MVKLWPNKSNTTGVPVWCTKCSQFGHIYSDCRMGKPRQTLEVDEQGFRPVKKSFRPKEVPKTQKTGPPEQGNQALVTHPDPVKNNKVEPGTQAKEGTLMEEPSDKAEIVLHRDNSFAMLNLAAEPESDTLMEAPSGSIALGADPISVND
jgi:hypothetical protein